MPSQDLSKCAQPHPTQATLPGLAQIEQFIEQILLDLLPEPVSTRGRPRILPALALWGGFLVCVLRGFSSQAAVWRLLHQPHFFGQPLASFSDEAVYKRLAKAGEKPLQTLFAQITSLLQVRLAPYYHTTLTSFATEVVALDETTLDQTARFLPSLRGLSAGDDQLLPGKLAALFDVRRQQWRKIEHIEPPHQNCKVAARTMLEDLPSGSLVLADLGYWGYEWFDYLTDQGYYWLSRVRAKTSTKVIHTFYQQGDTFDGLVWLGAYRADQAAHAVRLIEFRQGATLYRYMTNVLDPRQLCVLEAARLYARRWDIELAFKTLKQHLNLHLLWSAKTSVILQQVWATLIIAQIVQALQVEIAGRAGVDPFEVSLSLLIEYLPQYAATNPDPLEAFLEQARHLRFIRASKRINLSGPVIAPSELSWPGPELVLKRTPRYAQRRC